jgi:hypothetical protein
VRSLTHKGRNSIVKEGVEAKKANSEETISAERPRILREDFVTEDLSQIKESRVGLGGISHLADYLADELSFFPWTDTEHWKRTILDLTLAKTNRGWFRDIIKPAWVYEESSDIWWTIPNSDSGSQEALVGVSLKEKDREREELSKARATVESEISRWPKELQKRWLRAVEELDSKWEAKRTLAETRSRVATKFENFLLPPLRSEADETLADSFFRSSRQANRIKTESFGWWKQFSSQKKVLLEAIWNNNSLPSRIIPMKSSALNLSSIS